MKIMHLRPDNGRPIGTIVKKDGLIGVAICSPNDLFNKKMGVHIAAGRAEKIMFSFESIPNRTVVFNGKTMNLVDFVEDTIYYMSSYQNDYCENGVEINDETYEAMMP